LYTSGELPHVNKILSKDQLLNLQELTKMMPISNDIKKYALEIVTKTRPDVNPTAKELLDYGASPRASIALILAGKAKALLNNRDHVRKEDLKEMAYPVLRHRLILNFESERKGVTTDDVVTKILKEV
jgi:MoxR-like ATPase